MDARGRERYRRALWTTFTTILARSVSIVTVLAMVPLTVRYLGRDQYGLLMTITSVVSLIAFADLGLGSGLVNAVSNAHGRDDVEAARRYVSTGFFLLAGLALLLGAAFAAAYGHISWAALFNVATPAAAGDAGPAVVVLVVCFLASMPLAAVERTQIAYQEGFINGLWAALGNLLGLLGIILAVVLRLGVAWLVFFIVGTTVLTMIANGGVLFLRRRPELRPKLSLVDRQASRYIMKLGTMFFVLQIAVALAYSSDNLVIARTLGSSAVTDYAVPMRLFTLIPTALLILFEPLWPAYGEAIARGDIEWVRRTLRRTLIVGLTLSCALAIPLAIAGPAVIRAWAGGAVNPSHGLLIGMALWAIISGTANAVAVFLNGANVITFQVIFALMMSIAALGAKIWLIHAIGLPGVVWGTIAAYSIFSIGPLLVWVPRVLRRLEGMAEAEAVAP